MSGAALRCHIAQPSISNAIMQLEEEFGKTFFIRQAKGVAPTVSSQWLETLCRALRTQASQYQWVLVSDPALADLCLKNAAAHQDELHFYPLQEQTCQRIF